MEPVLDLASELTIEERLASLEQHFDSFIKNRRQAELALQQIITRQNCKISSLQRTIEEIQGREP